MSGISKTLIFLYEEGTSLTIASSCLSSMTNIASAQLMSFGVIGTVAAYDVPADFALMPSVFLTIASAVGLRSTLPVQTNSTFHIRESLLEGVISEYLKKC